MSEKCLIVELDDKNCFVAPTFLELNGKRYGCKFKIDTGCSYSTIPFRRITNIPEEMALQYKKQAIESGVRYMRSYGVSDNEDTRARDKELLIQGDLIACKALKFLNKDIPMNISGYEAVCDVYVNYDRTSNPLIGVDILKNFVYVCANSRITDRHTFIGCLGSQPDKTEFYKKIEEHFGLLSE